MSGGDYVPSSLSEGVGKAGKLLRYKKWRDFRRVATSLGDIDDFLFWSGKKAVLELFFREVRPFLEVTSAIWVGVVKKKLRKCDFDDFLAVLDVLRGGRDAGYVDVNEVSISDSEYALKFVIPINQR